VALVYLLLLLVFAFVAVVVVQFRRRLHVADLPRPSLRVRRSVVAIVTVICVALHVWSYWPLHSEVSPEMKPGTVIYGGPGDGLWFMLVILFPWVLMQFVNVGLALYCSRTVGQAARAWAVLLGLWIAASFAGGSLIECPAGMVCRGG
jgi:amino acid transporter